MIVDFSARRFDVFEPVIVCGFFTAVFASVVPSFAFAGLLETAAMIGVAFLADLIGAGLADNLGFDLSAGLTVDFGRDLTGSDFFETAGVDLVGTDFADLTSTGLRSVPRDGRDAFALVPAGRFRSSFPIIRLQPALPSSRGVPLRLS